MARSAILPCVEPQTAADLSTIPDDSGTMVFTARTEGKAMTDAESQKRRPADLKDPLQGAFVTDEQQRLLEIEEMRHRSGFQEAQCRRRG